VNFFDTSDKYGYGDHPYSGSGKSEEFLGTALGSRRPEVIVATKFGLQMGDNEADQGAGADYVPRACEASLRRLGTDYIDLYQIHFPDPKTPIAETLGALNDLVTAGKVREIGCSNFTVEQLEEAAKASSDGSLARLLSVQNEYSLLHRDPEPDVLPACERLDIAFLPYFPLASGLLTGKYTRGEAAPEGSRLAFWNKPREHHNLDDDTLARVEQFAKFAEQHDHSLLELAMSWLLARPTVASVIAGATSPAQVHSNAASVGWDLTADDLAELDRL
jgi:aryl-alcohol dehydrogenase-like predicted oxidoreductase